ncbi:MAG: class I SAM-dependent methyltransferase, partial [Terracidiphilus sp.]
GDSFHPGGLDLTRRLGELLHLGPQSRVLDAACGKGTSAVFLAEHFGCKVVGVDYSTRNVCQTNELAAANSVASRVHCERADSELLPFPDGSYDAVICECAFCTFPNKTTAANEFVRVLRARGQVGLSDLTRSPVLSGQLDGLLARIACVADAQPIEGYEAYLEQAGLRVSQVEKHDDALQEMVQQIRGKLFGAEVMVGLKKLELPGGDLQAAKEMAKNAQEAITRGHLGYVLISAVKQ